MRDIKRVISELAPSVSIILGSGLIHLGIIWLANLFSDAIPFGDIGLYEYWAYQVAQGGPLYGISVDWVYPAPALFPMLLVNLLSFDNYQIAWLVLMFVLNTATALALSIGTTGRRSAWLYLIGIALLGPIAISRIDSISVVLATFGLLAVAGNRKLLATTLFTFAGWIKIWPVALFVSLWSSGKEKLKLVALAAGISFGIVIQAVAVSGTTSIFSFLFQQASRGIQIESVLATPYLWLAKLQIASIYFDEQMITNQVKGPWVLELSAISTIVLIGALAITAVLAIRAKSRGVSSQKVFALAAVTGVLDLIVFNKVGSPQFMIWILVPLIALIVFDVQRIRLPLILGAGILFLTQLVYPIFYIELLNLELPALILISIRNSLLVALLVWGNLRLMSEEAFEQSANFVSLDQEAIVTEIGTNDK
ncbi:MAG: hypothetical protein ACKOXT_03215 [Actinomycetota bacterium]